MKEEGGEEVTGWRDARKKGEKQKGQGDPNGQRRHIIKERWGRERERGASER